MKNNLLFTAAAVVCIAAGCRSYTKAPIDWNEESHTGITNEVHIASLDDAVMFALVANREINAMRLKAGNSAKAAKESGWWEDPEFDMDFMRIVNPSAHPFLGGGSVAFTLPLSGATAIAAKAQELYAEADAAQLKAAETDLAAEVRRAVTVLSAHRKRARMINAYNCDARIVRTRENIEALHKAGEASASELAGMLRQKHVHHHALMDAERAIAEAEIKLLQLLGLRPGAKVILALSDDSPAHMKKIAGNAPAAVSPIALTTHPKVKAALKRLGASEEALRAEIRRQYPDLKLGPSYVNEEGMDRFGLVAGISIPLWNRNRKGIADAEGRRDETRLEAIDVWRELVCDAAAAHAHLAILLAHPPLPANEREQADRLSDAGELSPLDYLAVREQIFGTKLDEADWKRDVALAVIEMERFTVETANRSHSK